MKKVKVGKSKIHGNGLFADEPIKRGDVIQLVHTMRELEPGVMKTTPTLLGRNYNHSEDSNALNVIDGNNRYLVALKEIEVGGEITTDYRTNPELEQPGAFTSNDNYISFDYDDTLTTPEGFKLAQQMNKEGKNLYVITARDKVTSQMIERAEAAGIPKENIIPAGSDEAKVRIIKENNINKHIDNKESVIKALGDTGELFAPDAYPDLKADFIEMDLSESDLNKLKEGGFIIDQYPDGGESKSNRRFKQRLMKRYPGMQDVYGAEGENLSIVKDPNYNARSAGYGDIEFTFPGDDPVLNYPNLVEEGGPDYNYPNPSPDKYTALYNPRGANRGDIFLDMMHGMRDDPNYQPLLQNFEKAVRDARGEDMDWYYDQQVKKGSTQSKERYDENYIDSQLRAELAPGSIGMFSHGRRDYRKDRKYDSPEMRTAAEDIRNYLKGEYKNGGEPKKKKRKTDDYGRYRSEDGNVRTPLTPEMQAVMPPDEWGQYIQEFPEVYTTRTKEQQDIRNALDYQQRMAELYPGQPTQSDAIQPADWLWQLGMLGAAGGLGKSAVQAAEAASSRALPYITGALETSIPGMASVPGATVGNALGAIAAVDSGRRLLDVPSQVQKGEYADAAANVLTGALDIGTAGMISPLYKGAKATATELKAALDAKNPSNFKIPEQWYKKELYDLYDKGTDSYKLVEIDVPQEVIPGRPYDDVKHKLKNLRNDLDISLTKHYLSRLFGSRPIGMSRDRIIADPKDARLFDSNTRYWLNRLYGNTPSGEEVISKHLLAKDYGKLYKEGLSFEEAQGIMKKYNDPDYKEVSKVLPGSPNGTFAYRNVTPSKVRSTNTGLTNADIDKEVANNIKWITSKEYARRRAANTGESLQEIQKSVDKIIKDADKAKFNLNANPKYMDLYDAEGMMSKKKWFRPAKVEVAADAEHPVKTLKHEIKHLYSPAIFDNRKVYKNYPALTAEDHYLRLGTEQQVRHLNAREQILAENNLPIDSKLSEEQVSEFVDRWGSKMNKMDKTKDFSSAEDFDDLWSEQAGSIQKEMLKARYNTDDVNFIGTLPTSQKVRFMSEYRDRLTKSITDALNNAWMTVPIAGGAGLNSLETSEQRYGGSISKLNKFIR